MVIQINLNLTNRQASRLNSLRKFYNLENATNLDKDEFASLIIKESSWERWKAYHVNFTEAYSIASDADQAAVDAILGIS
jgi:hypothetical protein